MRYDSTKTPYQNAQRAKKRLKAKGAQARRKKAKVRNARANQRDLNTLFWIALFAMISLLTIKSIL